MLKNLLPVIQEICQAKQTKPSKEDKSIQCDELIEFRVSLNLASWLQIPSGSVFLEASTRKLTEPKIDARIRLGSIKRSSLVYFKEACVQTCELETSNVKEILIEKLAAMFMQADFHPKLFMRLLERLSSESISKMYNQFLSSSDKIEMCKKFILLR